MIFVFLIVKGVFAMKDNYYILINKKQLIEVSLEVWQVYYRMRAKERYAFKIFKQKCVTLSTSIQITYSDLSKSPEEMIIRKLEYEKLYLAINSLNSIERKVIIEYFFLGFNETEIGTHLGITQQAISLRKKNALKKLRVLLQDRIT